MANRRQSRRARPRAKAAVQRVNAWWLAGFLMLLVTISWSGLAVVSGAQDMRALYQDLGAVQREQDRLLEETSRLSLERSTISSLQKIEEIAARDLGMRFPEQIRRVSQ